MYVGSIPTIIKRNIQWYYTINSKDFVGR